MAKRLKVYATYTFSTSPHSCYRTTQWRTEHKCRPGRRPHMPTFQEKNCWSGPKKTSTNSPKFLTTFF